MDAIKQWLLDPNSPYVCPLMLCDQLKRILRVNLLTKEDGNDVSRPDLIIGFVAQVGMIRIVARGGLKLVREEADGVVLLPLGDGLEIQGMRVGEYDGLPMTRFHVPLDEDMRTVELILLTVMEALV